MKIFNYKHIERVRLLTQTFSEKNKNIAHYYIEITYTIDDSGKTFSCFENLDTVAFPILTLDVLSKLNSINFNLVYNKYKNLIPIKDINSDELTKLVIKNI